MSDIKLIPLAEARTLGLRHYFTGVPCKHGHISERTVTDRKCVVCGRIAVKNYLAANPEVRSKHYVKNKEKILARKRSYKAQWYVENRARLLEKQKILGAAYKRNNPEKHCAAQAKRRASKLCATPNWLTEEQLAEINRKYELAKWCSNVTGAKYHVDHIVPLRGDDVCGLHVPWNLQVIQASENMSKGNRYVRI